MHVSCVSEVVKRTLLEATYPFQVAVNHVLRVKIAQTTDDVYELRVKMRIRCKIDMKDRRPPLTNGLRLI